MKSTTLAILATILPAQMAFAGDSASNEMDALQDLNNKGYVDLGIEESNDAIVVFGYKKGKRVALTYTKGDFDLVGKRVTKVKSKKASSGGGDIARAERDTDNAREDLEFVRREGYGDQDIAEAEAALEEAEAEEDAIRADIAAAAPKKGKKVNGPGKKKKGKKLNGPGKKMKSKKVNGPGKKVKGDIARAERDTENAREDLDFVRREGYGDQDIAEAEAALEEAEAEEDGIRADNAKAAAKKGKKVNGPGKKKKGKKVNGPGKKVKGDIARAERDTENAREDLAFTRREGFGDQDIAEAEAALEEAEAEEEGIRADNAR